MAAAVLSHPAQTVKSARGLQGAVRYNLNVSRIA